MADPIILLAQVADGVTPNALDAAEGAGILALTATLAWVIGVVRSLEKYQALKEKYDSVRGFVGGVLDVGQSGRAMSDNELAAIVAERGMKLTKRGEE